MPRVNSTEQYRRHHVLKIIWRDHPKLYAILPAHQQRRLHRYYQPCSLLTQDELDEHRGQVALAEPSLPSEAGRAFCRLKRLYVLSLQLSQSCGAPIDVCLNAAIQHVVGKCYKVVLTDTTSRNSRGVYVVGVARLEPNVRLLVQALLELAGAMRKEKVVPY